MKNPTLSLLPLLALALFLSVAPRGLGESAWGQEDLFPSLEDLELRAEEVTLRYPWLLQSYSGLSVNASFLPREEFLQGLTAATDVLFEGTEELPVAIDLVGRYPNLAVLIDAFCREQLTLDCEVDLPNRIVRFGPGAHDSAGLSDIALISRYRRGPIDPNLIRRNYGMHFSGMLIVDGSPIPHPLEFLIEPLPSENRVLLKVNGRPVTEVAHIDPLAIDRNLYEAPNMEQFKAALETKLDHSWRMTSRFPIGSTREILALFSRQAAFLYGVSRAEPLQGGLRVHLAAGSHLDWVIPRKAPELAYDMTEAYGRVQTMQNQVIGGLSSGGVVFLSNRFGVRVIHPAFEFNRRLNAIVAELIDLRQKERRIRMDWRPEADWVLEYFYTSLVSDSWTRTSPTAPPPSIPSAAVPSIPSPIETDPERDALIQSYLDELEGVASDPLPSDPVAREILPRERGLIPPPASDFSNLPDEEEIDSFEIEVEVEGRLGREEGGDIGLDGQPQGDR